jgi:hypothetical protein
VALDLSACTMSGTEFDPVASDTGTHRNAAKGKIVSLVLPDMATSVPAGNFSNPTFKNFTNLKSVAGSKVETIGQYAFYGCTKLETIDLRAATSIGAHVFRETGTQALTVTLGPVVPTLGENMFLGVNAPKTVTVQVPSNAAVWSSIISGSPYEGSGGTGWVSGFKGDGWNGSQVMNNTKNINITLIIETYQ